MNFLHREKPMFQTVFSCSSDERLQLLDYLRFLHVENVEAQVLNHPAFAPAPLWKNWASESFLGFSLEKLLLQGGHAFPSSVEVGLAEGVPDLSTRLRRAAGAVRRAFGVDEMRQGRDPKHLVERFKRFYPTASPVAEHAKWYRLHPNPYFRCLEADLLSRRTHVPASMLEVGGGACVNVAFFHSLNPTMRTIVVDLPETVFAGYAFLKTVQPHLRITLPHEVDRSAVPGVTFLLPTQTDKIPDDSVEFAFNMSSFQEMEIETVNQYLRLMRRALVTDGRLVSVNLKASRYIAGNRIENYDFAGYASLFMKPAPFGTSLVSHLDGLEIIHAEAVKGALAS